MVLIWIMIVLAAVIFGVGIFLDIKYILCVNKDNHKDAERAIAYAGYYSVLSMILLFVICAVGFNHSKVELDRSYFGLLAALGSLVLIPFLIIADIKQIRYIKSLSDNEKEKQGLSMKDRTPLIAVVIVLLIINFGLLGLNIEEFIYVFSGLLKM